MFSTAINFICDHPDIKAVSFIGSNQAGEYIYDRATKTGKRVQSNMGAKNHGVIMPDAAKVLMIFYSLLSENDFLFEKEKYFIALSKAVVNFTVCCFTYTAYISVTLYSIFNFTFSTSTILLLC